ncbi:MAG: response regulator transcription factor [Tannerella sp.]|jgi:DNA-binding NarL/FixJ family response regulator|nr:response regulator transcription factor [Tannerella sp.]
MGTDHFPLIRVQIVDDHKLLTDSLSRVINESDIARITTIYPDLESCRKGLATEVPDVLLLDIDLPDGDGVPFCAEITKACPGLKIIMLTSFTEFNIVKHALYNGALGYILKNVDPKELLAGIETVNRGEQFLCKEINTLLKDRKTDEVIFLTNTEKLVLQLIADGHTRKSIAKLLHHDEQTTKTFMWKLRHKLGVKKTAELIKKSCRLRLIVLK